MHFSFPFLYECHLLVQINAVSILLYILAQPAGVRVVLLCECCHLHSSTCRFRSLQVTLHEQIARISAALSVLHNHHQECWNYLSASDQSAQGKQRSYLGLFVHSSVQKVC